MSTCNEPFFNKNEAVVDIEFRAPFDFERRITLLPFDTYLSVHVFLFAFLVSTRADTLLPLLLLLDIEWVLNL